MRRTLMLLVFFVAALPLTVSADRIIFFCDTDQQCGRNECCAQDFSGNSKICRDIPDDFGDICGGPYACPRCGDRRTCKPIVSGTTVDRVSVTGRCGRKKFFRRRTIVRQL